MTGMPARSTGTTAPVSPIRHSTTRPVQVSHLAKACDTRPDGSSTRSPSSSQRPNPALQSELAALAADPALSRFVEPDGALLVVGADGERLLWASPGAGRLREVLANEDGRLLGVHPLTERARALAGGLAPFAGLRLERIRLGSGALAPLVTCGFRQVGLSS